MAIDVYLVDYTGNDEDRSYRTRLQDLRQAATWAAGHHVGNNKILVAPEAFFGNWPIDGYGRWG